MRCSRVVRRGQVVLDDIPHRLQVYREYLVHFCTLCLCLFRGVLQYVNESGAGKQKPTDVLVCPAASDSTGDSILLRA